MVLCPPTASATLPEQMFVSSFGTARCQSCYVDSVNITRLRGLNLVQEALQTRTHSKDRGVARPAAQEHAHLPCKCSGGRQLRRGPPCQPIWSIKLSITALSP